MRELTLAKVGLLALSLLMPLTTVPVRAQDDVDISIFYDELEQYGRWFRHERYGYVWAPDVDEDWRPYTRGHWIYTDDNGWYWDAEEPWGWGPFHYGRWLFDDEYGWIWIPGTEWGPAWVAWRYSDEYVGWAPLPPEAEWYEDRGLTFSSSYYDRPGFDAFWIFLAPRYMILPGCYRYALPPARNRFVIRQTRWGTHYRHVDRRIFNVGYDVRRFERVTNRPVKRVRLIGSDRPRGLGFRSDDRSRLHVYRPRLRVSTNPPPRLVDPPRRHGGPGFVPRDKGGPGIGQEPRLRRDQDRAPVVRPGLVPQEKGGPKPGSPALGQPQPKWKQPDDDQKRRGVRREPEPPLGTGGNMPPPRQLRQQEAPQQWKQPQAGPAGPAVRQPRPEQQFKQSAPQQLRQQPVQPPPQQLRQQPAPSTLQRTAPPQGDAARKGKRTPEDEQGLRR
jgi:hypothetical protein